MTRTILPRVLAGYQRLGVGPDRLPKFAREQAMELHNRRVKDMRASSVELVKQSFVTTWRIVKDEEPDPVAADKPLMPNCYGNFHAGKTKARECGLCTEVDACKRLTARADAKMPKPLPVAADKPLPHDSRVVVTNPDAYKGAADKPAPLDAATAGSSLAAWASGYCPTCHQHKDVMGMLCNDPWHVEQMCAIGRADQPAGDDAAVEALSKAYAAEMGEGFLPSRNAVRAQVAAIRRGEVLGIGTIDGETWAKQWADDVRSRDEQIADLRARLAEATKFGESWHKQHDEQYVECEKAEAERDRLTERVAELEREHAELATAEIAQITSMRAERDKALAELAAERELSMRLRTESMAALKKTEADLAAMMERAEKAEESQRLTQKAREDDRGRLQQKCSDWGTYWRASDAHGVKLNLSQAAELLEDALGVEVEIDARAEADALRKLLKEACEDILTYDDDNERWNRQSREFRDKCRAAGVEVES